MFVYLSLLYLYYILSKYGDIMPTITMLAKIKGGLNYFNTNQFPY